MRLLSIVLAGTLIFDSAFAAQSLSTKIHNQYSSIRALGMGNAFTAVADDYSLLFYNPAGLARKPYNEVQISLLGAGVSSKTMTIAKDISDASDTPGSDNDKAQAISDVLDRYYGESLGGKLQALELFWVRKNWGVALIPLDMTIDMSVNRQLGPALDLNIKGDTTAAFGYGRSVTKDIDAGVTVKYIHRVAVEQSVSALELATNPDVLSEDRFKEGTALDFDLGFMWTPPIWGKKIVKKTVVNKGEGDKIELKKEETPAAPEAPAEPPPVPAVDEKASQIKEDDLKDKSEAAPAADAAAPANTESVPAPENIDDPAKRTPQQAIEDQSEAAKGFEPSPERKEPTKTPEDKSKMTPEAAETAAQVEDPETLKEIKTKNDIQVEKVTPPPVEDEVVTTEEVVKTDEMSYPLNFGLVIHNALESSFALSKLVNKNAVEAPSKLERVVDVGAQYKIVNGEDFKIRLMLDAKNLMHPEATLNKTIHAGVEFDYSPSGWFRSQLRAGMNQMYYTAGATLLLGIVHIDLATYGEEVGTSSQKKENRVYAAKLGFNF